VSFNVLNRKVHYWVSFAVAVPMAVMIGSGILLQGKKQFPWVQPPEVRGTGTSPVLDLEGILAAVKTVPEMNLRGWDDVNRLDVRVGRGMVKVWLMNGYEVQVDLGTGAVLQTAYRRSDLIESIHDGSFFGGDWTKLGLFLPTGIALALLWLGGIWMWWVPFIAKRRRRRVVDAARRAAMIVITSPLAALAAL
jgi:uncharacterized iron-regulated membrane protein